MTPDRALARDLRARRVAAAITCLSVTVGMGAQVGRVVEKQSAADLSPTFLVLALATYLSWVVSGSLMRPPVAAIVVPNLLGAIGTFVLVVLWFAFG
jgi:uncharacterized protein with PQ loop repeat